MFVHWLVLLLGLVPSISEWYFVSLQGSRVSVAA